MSILDLLRRSPLFARFEQVLIEPRTPGAGLFVICDGSVVAEAHGKQRELGRGDVVGEISLLEEDGLRRARVVAKTPVTCLALGRTDFERLLSAEPEFAEAMRQLAREQLAELEGSS